MRLKAAFAAFSALLALFGATYLFAQATNPPYLAEFPPVDKVSQAMKTSDPDETAARQMAAFQQLIKMVQDMAGPRILKSGYTPDENKLRTGYNAAYYKIAQSNPKYGPFTAMRGLDISTQFRNELIAKTFNATFADEYAKAVGLSQQQYADLHAQATGQPTKAQIDQANAKAEALKAQNQLHQTLASMPRAMTEDQRSLAICAAAGRSQSQCLGTTLTKGFNDMANQVAGSGGMGSLVGVVAKMSAPAKPGPYISGIFSAVGNLSVTFGDSGATVANCGTLVPYPYPYSLSISNSGESVTVQTTPQPLVFTARPDGKFAGPGAIKLNGSIITGYQQQKVTEYRGNAPINSYTQSVPVYGPSTQSCNAGVLSPSPAASGGAASTVLSLFTGGDDTKPTPPGVRMSGEFDAANGFGIKFYPETAVFICGVAVAPHDYSVQSTGSQVVVDIKDSPKPDLFTLNSDGSLTGSGSVTVNGKTMFGNEDDDGNLVFQPASNTCQVGQLKLRGTGPVSSPTFPAAVAGNAILNLKAPLASPGGSAIMLLNQSVQSLVQASGFQPTAGSSLLKTYAACKPNDPNCAKAMSAVIPHIAGYVVTFPSTPTSFSNLQPGTYYLTMDVTSGGKKLFWDLKVDLKSGANSITLDASNALSVDP
ncbi:MAG TPA: hypothetical protein VFO34_11535 [Candidatus Acidoferrales bacterium]|nr:hypothetical protein [Candidatus Acidoferrales bacterium]